MLPPLTPTRNDANIDVSALLPQLLPPRTPALRPEDEAVWLLAEPHLKTRGNDVHSLYAYGFARALLEETPDADPDIVLPAILLHDTGWSTVPLPEIMTALLPGARSTPASFAVVRKHEIEGARIAAEVLTQLDRPAPVIATVVEIIDGHDTRKETLSVEDALVKDADKVWRCSPHGIETVMDWFGLTRAEAHQLNAARTFDALYTAPARTMARALSAVAVIDTYPDRVRLG